jgi:antitoxin (DNA-binding transcriptional repressor) of toxin-antitoxin stability system
MLANQGGMMKIVNIHDAKTNLSALIEAACTQGETFVIAKAGKPMVTVTPVALTPRRLGSLHGQFKVPDDFDTMDAAAIADEFEGAP